MKYLEMFIFAGISAAALSSSSALAASGEDTYKETCIACHGETGTGELPGMTPDFTKKDGVLSQDNAVLLEHVTNGFESPGSQMAMPPLGGNDELTEEDVKEVLKYVKKTFLTKK